MWVWGCVNLEYTADNYSHRRRWGLPRRVCRKRRGQKAKPKKIPDFEVYVSKTSQQRRLCLCHKGGGKAEGPDNGLAGEEDTSKWGCGQWLKGLRSPVRLGLRVKPLGWWPWTDQLGLTFREQRLTAGTAEGVSLGKCQKPVRELFQQVFDCEGKRDAAWLDENGGCKEAYLGKEERNLSVFSC